MKDWVLWTVVLLVFFGSIGYAVYEDRYTDEYNQLARQSPAVFCSPDGHAYWETPSYHGGSSYSPILREDGSAAHCTLPLLTTSLAVLKW
jgi:hypothetical protein